MENLCSDVILQIILYLDVKSLFNFDTSMSDKTIRNDYLSAIKKLKNTCINYISYWSSKRGIMLGKKQICAFNMVNYVSKDCKYLILNNGINYYDNRLCYLNISNNHVNSLHIDLYNNKRKILNTISGTNIKMINIVKCIIINYENLIDKIKIMCPNIKKIQIIDVYVLNTNNFITKRVELF